MARGSAIAHTAEELTHSRFESDCAEVRAESHSTPEDHRRPIWANQYRAGRRPHEKATDNIHAGHLGNRAGGLLREAMELRQSYRRGEASDYVAETERLRREVSYHLRDRPMPDRDNGRLQNELGWHDDRGNLLRFLDDQGIEPTNNRAERALRGAVIARKVSHCSKNEDGADAFSAFTSVIRTLARNGGDQSLVDGLCGVFSGAPVHARST